MPTAQHGRASIEIAAPPQVVYDLIADVRRMGEWSPECYRCEWLDGVSAAVLGARFRGFNRIGRFRWERTALICAAERGREFIFETVDDHTQRHETWIAAHQALGHDPHPAPTRENPEMWECKCDPDAVWTAIWRILTPKQVRQKFAHLAKTRR